MNETNQGSRLGSVCVVLAVRVRREVLVRIPQQRRGQLGNASNRGKLYLIRNICM